MNTVKIRDIQDTAMGPIINFVKIIQLVPIPQMEFLSHKGGYETTILYLKVIFSLRLLFVFTKWNLEFLIFIKYISFCYLLNSQIFLTRRYSDNSSIFS